ncbi:lactonase family protein [Paenibacillus sp. HB172176]|uniref:lactonase family protein n=1 Tax=Paenibacillus sp. HB172176 TaxID=2493690 RepID=UPI0014387679|nr:lactonase family protein [Paenibacillus sp. HB172176]
MKITGWNEGILYIGSYGKPDEETIHVCQMDKKSGELHVLQAMKGVENASFLALHPKLNRLYAVREVGDSEGKAGGSVVSIEIEPDGLLKNVRSHAASEGASPCYISVDTSGKAVFAANYSSGNVAMIPLSDNGDLLQEGTVGIRQAGAPGPIASRQEGPHAHCIAAIPGTSFVVAADLGIDTLITYHYQAEEGGFRKVQECRLTGGKGPRHLVFHPELSIAYVTNELASSVTLLDLDKSSGALVERKTYSTISEDYRDYNDSADIHLSPDGRFLYASNRGHNSIACFSIDQASGDLEPVQFCGSGGELPRNFGIVPEGDFLLAANHKSGNVVVFRRNPEDGTIAPTGFELQLQAPVCICFANE